MSGSFASEPKALARVHSPKCSHQRNTGRGNQRTTDHGTVAVAPALNDIRLFYFRKSHLAVRYPNGTVTLVVPLAFWGF